MAGGALVSFAALLSPIGRVFALLALCLSAGLASSEPAGSLGTSAPAPAQSTEYKVKAAFLYNFAKLTTWPKGSFGSENDPIVVTVVGDDPFGKILEAVLGGKKVGKRPLKLERVSDPAKLGKAHIVYMGKLGQRDRAALLKTLRKRNVLTIGERSDFTKTGGVCRFYSEKGKLRFEVNVDAVGRAQLDLSSQLLKLARIVRD